MGVRQLVVRRLRGMLNGLDRVGRQPNRRETYYICQAMEHLQAGRLEENENSVRRAARLDPVPPDAAMHVGYNETPTVEEQHVALERMKQN